MRQQTFVIVIMSISFLILNTQTSLATVEVSGLIANDTTWTSTDTIIVTDHVTVADTACLSIQPGTVILFNPGRALRIHGQLTANGEVNNRTMFTSSADTIGGSPYAGKWLGVTFYSGSAGTLKHCNLRYAFQSVYDFQAVLELSSCVIENFSSSGIYIDGYNANPPTSVTIEHCIIRQDDMVSPGIGTGIYEFRSIDLTISRCEVSNCVYGIEFVGSGTYRPYFRVDSCEIRGHAKYGIYVHSGG